MIDYDELKQQAIELRQQGLSLAQIARRLGVHKSAAARWVANVPFAGQSDESRQESLAAFRDNDKFERARALRRAGWSQSMIAAEVRVSKSTLSGWLQGVEVENRSIIEERSRAGRIATANINRGRAQARASKVQDEAIEEIDETFEGGFTDRELFLAGLMLYWGEGAKTHNAIMLANSDPNLIKVFLRWLRECLMVADHCMRVRVYCYPDTDIAAAEMYWSEITNIPLEQFYKAQVDTRTNKSLDKKGKLEYGTVQVKVFGEGSSDLHRKILGWLKGLGQNLAEDICGNK